jgi:hypothetical protein
LVQPLLDQIEGHPSAKKLRSKCAKNSVRYPLEDKDINEIPGADHWLFCNKRWVGDDGYHAMVDIVKKAVFD